MLSGGVAKAWWPVGGFGSMQDSGNFPGPPCAHGRTRLPVDGRRPPAPLTVVPIAVPSDLPTVEAPCGEDNRLRFKN